MQILVTEKSTDYELVDSGNGEKLERYGAYVLRRPDPQVLWEKTLLNEWDNADAVYERSGVSGKWKKNKEIDASWSVNINNISFSVELLPSKHLGVFPEQSPNWNWLEEKIKKENGREVSVLNLFGYTGGATIACSRAGAKVCHVDSSKFAVDLAHKNLNESGLSENPVRFIVEDVRKFVEREINRGNKYDVVIMDPPVYGKGVKKEVWKIEDDLLPLLKKIKKILSNDPVAILVNGYSSIYSSTTYKEALKSLMADFKGETESGELTLKESSSGRLLTEGIFARWSK